MFTSLTSKPKNKKIKRNYPRSSCLKSIYVQLDLQSLNNVRGTIICQKWSCSYNWWWLAKQCLSIVEYYVLKTSNFMLPTTRTIFTLVIKLNINYIITWSILAIEYANFSRLKLNKTKLYFSKPFNFDETLLSYNL